MISCNIRFISEVREHIELGGRYFGVLYVMFDNGYAFPDYQWTDFTASVLNMWILEISECFFKRADKFVLYFLDGPFRIECSRTNKDLNIAFINARGNTEEIVQECTVDALSFIDGVRTAALHTIDSIKEYPRYREYSILKGNIRIMNRVIRRINME